MTQQVVHYTSPDRRPNKIYKTSGRQEDLHKQRQPEIDVQLLHTELVLLKPTPHSQLAK